MRTKPGWIAYSIPVSPLDHSLIHSPLFWWSVDYDPGGVWEASLEYSIAWRKESRSINICCSCTKTGGKGAKTGVMGILRKRYPGLILEADQSSNGTRKKKLNHQNTFI